MSAATFDEYDPEGWYVICHSYDDGPAALPQHGWRSDANRAAQIYCQEKPGRLVIIAARVSRLQSKVALSEMNVGVVLKDKP